MKKTAPKIGENNYKAYTYKGLIPRLYKELLKLNQKTKVGDRHRHFSTEDIQMANKYLMFNITSH